MSDRFYTPAPLAPGEFLLDGPEAHHLAAVRRFAAGERVVLFNDDGRDYPAEVVSVGKRSVVLNVLAAVEADRELGFPLVVAAALPKGDRADFLIEKLTELGATRFVPLITTRAVVQPKDAKVEKFERAVIEASKQCGRNVLMRMSQPMRWGEFLHAPDLPPLRLLPHTEGGEPLRDVSRAELRTGVVAAVGPEGGFTPEELAQAAHWRRVTLGPRVLRVETAALAVAAWAALR
jgi:16S rRNA (uracil1498-N3)-methyltransferase